MQFTFDAYRNLICSLREHDYEICGYHDWEDKERCVILRHDIDNDIAKALELAKVEADLGISSTYFVLVSCDFYNVFSARNARMLKELALLGHVIGLHFDELRYPEIKVPEDACSLIQREARLLEQVLGTPVTSVSMHRPSKMILEADLQIPGIVNSYGQTYFKEFKYLSDSRRRWREPVEEIIAKETYDRLHILTHAIWYNETELDIHDTIAAFIRGGNLSRYEAEKENITDLETIMKKEELF